MTLYVWKHQKGYIVATETGSYRIFNGNTPEEAIKNYLSYHDLNPDTRYQKVDMGYWKH